MAQTFFMDEDVQSRTRLDAIVTVVDARHIAQRLGDSHEAQEQIAFADVILLNKTDLIDPGELLDVQSRIRSMNATAEIHRTQKCDIPLDAVLGRGAFDVDCVLEFEPKFLEDVDHEHDDDVKSLSLSSEAPLDPDVFSRWIQALLRQHGQDLLRLKGILAFPREDRRFVCQAVHMLLDGDLLQPWPAGDPRRSRLVLIGRNLPEASLRAGFQACVVN